MNRRIGTVALTVATIMTRHQGGYTARNAISTQDESPARFMEVTQLEERVLMSASPLAVVAAPPEAAAAAATTELAATTAPSTNDTFRLDDQELLDVVGDAVLPEQSADGETDAVDAELEPETSNLLPDASEQKLELVFVDGGVSDIDQMVNDLQSAYTSDNNRTLEIVILDSHADGMDQISSALQNYTDMYSIHIVSHGSDAQVRLGSTTLSLDTLDSYAIIDCVVAGLNVQRRRPAVLWLRSGCDS